MIRKAQHYPQEDPCKKCGRPVVEHEAKFRNGRTSRPAVPEAPKVPKSPKLPRAPREPSPPKLANEDDSKKVIIGIDGEGVNTEDGGHLYTYFAAVDEYGVCRGDAYDPKGLSHDRIMAVIMSLPQDALIFGYSIGYDMTKIFEALPLKERYILMRPNKRVIKTCLDQTCARRWNGRENVCPKCGNEKFRTTFKPVEWNGRRYNYEHKLYVFQDQKDPEDGKWGRSVRIWDCFTFFGCAFVEALKNWQIGTPEQRAEILNMKDVRGTFTEEMAKRVNDYCRNECHFLALMMRKLLTAHTEADINLDGQYRGAGSSGGALLNREKVDLFKTEHFDELPIDLKGAVMSSFFGGRFENSVVGEIDRPIYGYDIASAYPYSETFLPSLVNGTWECVSGPGLVSKIEAACLACCHYTVGVLPQNERDKIGWMPLPFRDSKGSICYPTNCSGWAWKPEILSALAGWGDLVSVDRAWVFHPANDERPFRFLPELYKRRIEWGKEGRGIVLKLACNATYGKTAQKIGKARFNDWIWAGNTTSRTRGMINELICKASDRWSILSIATDGIYSLEPLDCPVPADTGTAGLVNGEGQSKPPLGGWEEKHEPGGLFIAKPGLYYSLSDKLQLKDVRARGVGRRAVFEARENLREGFRNWDRQDLDYFFPLPSNKFHGAKQTIYAMASCRHCETTWVGVTKDGCPKCGGDGTQEHFNETSDEHGSLYGRWTSGKVRIAFDCHPKRERRLELGGTYSRQFIRDVGGAASAEYLRKDFEGLSPNAREEVIAREFAEVQPDGFYSGDFED